LLLFSSPTRPRLWLGQSGQSGLVGLLVGGLVAIFAPVPTVHAGGFTYTVTGCTDSTHARASGATLNLDTALAAQATNGGAITRLSCHSDIDVDQLLDITTASPLTINGAKFGTVHTVALDGGGVRQDIDLQGIYVHESPNLALVELTIQGGTSPVGDGIYAGLQAKGFCYAFCDSALV
jgi:hypothetical protein